MPPTGTRGRPRGLPLLRNAAGWPASIAESRRHSSPECGEQRPSKNIVRIISILLWYFPNRPGAAGWLHLATYRHECARAMCILWAVHLGLGSRGVSPSFSGGWRWGCGVRSRFPGGAPASGPAPFFSAPPAYRALPLTSQMKPDANEGPAAAPRDVQIGLSVGYPL